MSDSDEQVYCICRSSDIDRFMIMCDGCEEWFHGDCINVTEKEAKHIKNFYCKPCRNKNPFLKIKYRKSKKKDKDRHERQREKDKLKKKKIKKKDSDVGTVHKSSSAPVFTSEMKGKYEADEAWEPSHMKRMASKEKKSNMAIHVYTSDEELQDSDGGLKHKPAIKKELLSESDENEIFVDDFTKSQKKKKDTKRCGRCENCLRTEDCDLCDACHDRRLGLGGKIPKCRLRRCINEKPKKGKSKFKDQTKREPPQKRSRINTEMPGKVPAISQSLLQTGLSGVMTNSVKQCFGPGCTNAANAPSKYCSEACGRRLARNRLMAIMPQRIQEWHSTPTVANDLGREEIERIRSRMEQARKELQALEQKYRLLESIISAAKSLTIDDKKLDGDDESETESDHLIYCVVCGHSVSLKSAIKHMDRCYIKIESQISFGSVYPTRIDGSQRLFCDVYNDQQQTYCKRLQVLCPEHTKEPKVSEDEVCGCPLMCDIYNNKPSTPAHFCRLAKRKCNKHFKWETMYRAEVDLQRIRQWLKIDEIFDEERRIKTAMSSRAGLVSLLLHQTTAHDPRCLDMRTKPTVTKKPAYRLMI